MKKVIIIGIIITVIAACNSNHDGATNNGDPNKVHPESETIPDSLKLVNDSTLVPDTVSGNGSAGTNDDSAKKQ